MKAVFLWSGSEVMNNQKTVLKSYPGMSTQWKEGDAVLQLYNL